MAATDAEADETEWMVLVNAEGQYSLWPALNDVPAGWRATGPVGSEETCRVFVEEVWTDMRPVSLRPGA